MKLSKVIQKMTDILKTDGDLDFVVDTEGAKYICNIVDVTRIYASPEDSEVRLCCAALDHSAKQGWLI